MTTTAANADRHVPVLDIDAPEPDRRSAYTALYHTLLGPTLFMDVDGRYRGPDQAVHTAEESLIFALPPELRRDMRAAQNANAQQA